MPDSTNTYRKLPGRRSAFLGFARNTLWLADDHFLHVINRGYTEEYKRFYFHDLQAVVLRKTATGKILALILALFSAFSAILFLVGWRILEWESIGLWIGGINSGFWILVLVVHLLRGETCFCSIKTAVQVESLPSLHRLRPAQRVLQILKDRTDSIQGTIADEALNTLAETHVAAPEVTPVNQSSIQPSSRNLGVHLALFITLVIDGVRLVANLIYTNFLFYGAGLFLYAALMCLVVFALIKQRNSNLPSLSKGIVWCTLVYLWIGAVAWYVYGIVLSIERPDAGLNYWELLRSIAQKPVLNSVPQMILHSFSAFCSLLFGIAGIVSLFTRPFASPTLTSLNKGRET